MRTMAQGGGHDKGKGIHRTIEGPTGGHRPRTAEQIDMAIQTPIRIPPIEPPSAPPTAPPRDDGAIPIQAFQSQFQPQPPPLTKGQRGLGNGGIFVTWFFLGVFSLIFAWYSTRISRKAQWIWTALVAVHVTVVVVIVAVALSSAAHGGGAANVEQTIQNNFRLVDGTTATDVSVTCVHGSSSYQCLATYTDSGTSYQQALTATCDSSNRVWQPDGLPQPASP